MLALHNQYGPTNLNRSMIEAPPNSVNIGSASLIIRTTMAPPVIYKTPAAKLQAERAKRRRYHEKSRRRDAILARRRQLRKDRKTRRDDEDHSDDDGQESMLNTCRDDEDHSDDDGQESIKIHEVHPRHSWTARR
ncbi:hypothetical protein CY34DRAFT_110354 [Suillus luteus UH-Slu-Lm8-n1]|uniref:Uncharacterized protein n=1 Tax=Suillus luteus UH-Slu-Lm8-n1 TaxID=930992 RepID=A0A0D0AQF2_9AGAM|nr:hypothetical protein CY34DRAFT_110354 [Suillus luteus UH-Slu-Lm8-n1]